MATQLIVLMLVITCALNFNLAHRRRNRDRDDSNESDGDRDSSYWNSFPSTTTVRTSTVTALPGFTINRNATVTIPPFGLSTTFDVRTG
uniref:Uncharacterized protein n=1 Tax=Anopheles dirus TaxID=7168 RepID=A0A182NYH9_9DIPT